MLAGMIVGIEGHNMGDRRRLRRNSMCHWPPNMVDDIGAVVVGFVERIFAFRTFVVDDGMRRPFAFVADEFVGQFVVRQRWNMAKVDSTFHLHQLPLLPFAFFPPSLSYRMHCSNHFQ